MFKQTDFIVALQFVAHAMAKKDKRYYLQGVHLTFPDSDTCQLEATNGERAARITITSDAWHGRPAGSGHIIEREAVLAVIAAFKGKSDATLHIEQPADAGDVLQFSSGAASVRAALIDARYPDTTQIWPRTEPTGCASLPVDPRYLADVIKAGKGLRAAPLGVRLETWDARSALRLRFPVKVTLATLSEAEALIMPMRN